MFLLSLLGLLGLLSFLVVLAASLTARDGFEDDLGFHFLDAQSATGGNATSGLEAPAQRKSERSYPKRAA